MWDDWPTVSRMLLIINVISELYVKKYSYIKALQHLLCFTESSSKKKITCQHLPTTKPLTDPVLLIPAVTPLKLPHNPSYQVIPAVTQPEKQPLTLVAVNNYCHLPLLPFTPAAIYLCCHLPLLPFTHAAIYSCCHSPLMTFTPAVIFPMLPFSPAAIYPCCHLSVLPFTSNTIYPAAIYPCCLLPPP